MTDFGSLSKDQLRLNSCFLLCAVLPSLQSMASLNYSWADPFGWADLSGQPDLFHPHPRVHPAQGKPFFYLYKGQAFSAKEVGLKEVEFEPRPFSEGKFREAYKGRVYIEECQPDHPSQSLKPLLSCWDFTKERPFHPCIVKGLKRSHAKYAHEWTKDIAVLKVAQSYSQKFN